MVSPCLVGVQAGFWGFRRPESYTNSGKCRCSCSGGRHGESIGGSGRINRPNRHAKGLRATALIIHCEKAHSRYFSEDVFKALLIKKQRVVYYTER